MQVPEKLALIGGSILLSSTLIFTLKSQASQILPKVNKTTSQIFDKINNVQHNFDYQFKQAQKDGLKTGRWGTAKYYIDKNDNLHIGNGRLQGRLYEAIGMDTMHHIHSINIDQEAQAPQDSDYLFSPVEDRMQDPTSNITSINGLNNLDVSKANNMEAMFANNSGIQSLDLSSWDTSQVANLLLIFNQDQSLKDLNMHGWNTKNVQNMSWMFYNVPTTKLDLSSFDTHSVGSTDSIYKNTSNLKELVLGKDTKNTPLNCTYLSNGQDYHWKNGNQVIDGTTLQDNNSHPGTWIRQ